MHLYSQAKGKLAFDERLQAFVPEAKIDGMRVVGAAAGVMTLAEILKDQSVSETTPYEMKPPGRKRARRAVSGSTTSMT